MPIHRAGTAADPNIEERKIEKKLREPSTIAVYALLVARALDASGIDSARVLKAAGLAITPSIDPLSRVPVTTLNRLFAVAVAETGDEYFGLKVAKFIQVSHMHALGHALAVSGTLMEFCVRLKRYMRLASHACEIDLVETSTEVRLTLVLLQEVQAEREDAFLAFLVDSMRQLLRPDFSPVRVDFHRAMPKGGSGPFEEFFRGEIAFGSANPALTFSRPEMHQVLVSANAELAGINEKLATRDLARLEKEDVVAVVRQRIVDHLPNGECTRDRVASSMHISGATLQLRLARQGTNFNALLDGVRRELAANYVRQPGLPLMADDNYLGRLTTTILAG